MLGNLDQDLIGTDPKYMPIVDHSWLQPTGYDNYPSDNNPLRKQPELADIWNPARQAPGVSLIENQTVQPLGVRTAEQKELETQQKVADVVREAKKAFMAGMGVKKAAEHLKSLFTEEYLKAAADELKTVSEERGLLGNVYIDASAFASYNEAEQFLTQHRNRLAQEILFDCERMNPGIVASLASKFRKNVVSDINYDDRTFRKYRDHLVMSGRIPEDFTIDSKEALRRAFLFVMPEPEAAPAKEPEKHLEATQIAEGLQKMAEGKRTAEQETAEILQWGSVRPVVSFVQEHLSKGKTASDLKEMVKGKFAREDLNRALPYLAVTLSSEGLSRKHLANLREQNKISEFAQEQLETISKMFPVTKSEYVDPMPQRSSGVQGRLHHLSSGVQASDNQLGQAAVIALRKGIEPKKVRARLTTKVGTAEADRILSAAMIEMNASPVGTPVNRKEIRPKQALIEEAKPRDRLPDPKTITDQLKEHASIYAGCSEMIVDIDAPDKRESYDIFDAGSKEGLDGAISDALS